MNHGSLFSGIGGFDLAASWMGWENIFQVERDVFCRRVLAKNFPKTKRYGDIYEFDGTEYCGAIDVLTGGFPCQPFSIAGKQRGKDDDRYLWPEMLRIIREIRPRWVVGENVAGIIKLALDQVLSDLEDEGYTTETFIIPACAVNAPHRRDRVWIVAHDESETNWRHNGESKARQEQESGKGACRTDASNPEKPGLEGRNTTWTRSADGRDSKRAIHSFWNHEGRPDWSANWLEVATRLCGISHGISRKLDRVNRLKALGNAIVPQVAYQIFKSIEKTERLR